MALQRSTWTKISAIAGLVVIALGSLYWLRPAGTANSSTTPAESVATPETRSEFSKDADTIYASGMSVMTQGQYGTHTVPRVWKRTRVKDIVTDTYSDISPRKHGEQNEISIRYKLADNSPGQFFLLDEDGNSLAQGTIVGTPANWTEWNADYSELSRWKKLSITRSATQMTVTQSIGSTTNASRPPIVVVSTMSLCSKDEYERAYKLVHGHLPRDDGRQ